MARRCRVLTDVHVNKVLSVLEDRSPHVCLALLVLVPSSLAGGGGHGWLLLLLLLLGCSISVCYHCFVCRLAILGVWHVAAVGAVAVFLNHLAECRLGCHENHKARPRITKDADVRFLGWCRIL